MKNVFMALLLFGTVPLLAQGPKPFDVTGVLRLVDAPPDVTPVEALAFRIHPLAGGFDIEAQPNTEGRFLLRNVVPGRYSLTFPMPGRLEQFAIGTRPLTPESFELSSNDHGDLSIVVSVKFATVSVQVTGFKSDQVGAVALLIPADDRLTLREFCYSDKLSGPNAVFQYLPPGKYRILVFNEKYSSDVAAYAPRFPGFLGGESVAVEASSEHEAVATIAYVPDEKVEKAILSAGGHFNPFKK